MGWFLVQALPVGIPDNSLPPGIGGGPIIPPPYPSHPIYNPGPGVGGGPIMPPGTPPGIWGGAGGLPPGVSGGPGSLPPGIWGGAGGLPPGIWGGPGSLPPGAGQLPVFPPPGVTPHTAVAGAPPPAVDAEHGAWILVNVGSGLVWCWAQAPGKPDHALPPGSPGSPDHSLPPGSPGVPTHPIATPPGSTKPNPPVEPKR